MSLGIEIPKLIVIILDAIFPTTCSLLPAAFPSPIPKFVITLKR